MALQNTPSASSVDRKRRGKRSFLLPGVLRAKGKQEADLFRGLRSFQSNVTRSATKSSVAARSVVNFHSKQRCDESPALRAKLMKKPRSRSQGSLASVNTGGKLPRASSVARASTRVRSPSIGRLSKEKSETSQGSTGVRGRKPGKKKLTSTTEPPTSNLKDETAVMKNDMVVNTDSNQTATKLVTLPVILKKRGRKKRIIEEPIKPEFLTNATSSTSVKEDKQNTEIDDNIQVNQTVFRKRGRKKKNADTGSVSSTSKSADVPSTQRDAFEKTICPSDEAFQEEKCQTKPGVEVKFLTKTVSQDKFSSDSPANLKTGPDKIDSLTSTGTHAQDCLDSSLELMPSNTAPGINTCKQTELEHTNLLDNPVRKGKSLKRELNNLSFSNPGKMFAHSKLPLPESDKVSSKGKALRRHSEVKYFRKQYADHSIPILSQKKSFSALSRMRVWKEKQAAMKRKIYSSSDNDGPSEITSSQGETESVIDTVDSTAAKVQTKIAINSSACNETDQHCSGIQSEASLVTTPEKRKRGRPPKRPRPFVCKSYEDIEQTPSLVDIVPSPSESFIPKDHPVRKKTKRKRRSYKGCLDVSFKSKKYAKKAKMPSTEASSMFDGNTLRSESNLQNESHSESCSMVIVDSINEVTYGTGVDDQSSLIPGFVVENILNEDVQNDDIQTTCSVLEQDFRNDELMLSIETDIQPNFDLPEDELDLSGHSNESSLHEEHSYAKNSPVIPPIQPEESEPDSEILAGDEDSKSTLYEKNQSGLDTNTSNETLGKDLVGNIVNNDKCVKDNSSTEGLAKTCMSGCLISETNKRPILDTGQASKEKVVDKLERSVIKSVDRSMDLDANLTDMDPSFISSDSKEKKLLETNKVCIQSRSSENVRNVSDSETEHETSNIAIPVEHVLPDDIGDIKNRSIKSKDSEETTYEPTDKDKVVKYMKKQYYTKPVSLEIENSSENENLSSEKVLCLEDPVKLTDSESLGSKKDKNYKDQINIVKEKGEILPLADTEKHSNSLLTLEVIQADDKSKYTCSSSKDSSSGYIKLSSNSAICDSEASSNDEQYSVSHPNKQSTSPLSILVDLADPHGLPPQLTPQLTLQSTGRFNLSPVDNSYMISPPVLQAQNCTKSPLEAHISDLIDAKKAATNIEKPEVIMDTVPDISVDMNKPVNKDNSELSSVPSCSSVDTGETILTKLSGQQIIKLHVKPKPIISVTNQVVFKRPRGRPKKIHKTGAWKSSVSVVPKIKKPKKTTSMVSKSITSKPVARTFALRPQISRSPLENIALRFGLQPGCLSVKKKSKLPDAGLNEPDDSNEKPVCSKDLLHKCKPCSVVLTDFVKHLDLTDLSSSEDEEWFDSDSETDVSVQTETEKPITQATGSKLQSVSSPSKVILSPRSPQSARKSVSYPFSTPKRNPFQSYSQEADVLASEILQMFANYKCKYCNFCSESVQLIEEHVRVHENYFSTFPIGCSLCGRRYTNKETYESHQSRLHPLESRQFVEFNIMDEKEHYQIVLQDGSAIDLKIPDVTVREHSEELLQDNVGLNSAFQMSDTTEVSTAPDFNIQQQGSVPYKNVSCASTSGRGEISCDLIKDAVSVISNVPKCNLTKAASVNKDITELMQNLLDKIDNNQSGKKISDKTSIPPNMEVQPSKSESHSPDDNSHVSDETTRENSGVDSVNKGNTSNQELGTSSKPVDSTAVNPIVEKLRKIVKSVPQSISKPKNAITTTAAAESNLSSVLLQTEQGGTMESSVLNSPTNAPVIVSVVISGNVDVSKSEISGKPKLSSNINVTSKFICTYCMYGSDDRGRMVEHVTLMHSDEAQFTCCICDKAFSSKMTVIHQHIKTSHPGEDVNKSCKPLPSFYAVDELSQHDSLRSKTSDNIFEMFGSSSESHARSGGENEPLRQHFRKARDVMCYREKARRQAEADSTTTCSGEETNINPLPDMLTETAVPAINALELQDNIEDTEKHISSKTLPITSVVENLTESDLCTDDGVTSSEKDPSKTSNSTDAVEEFAETSASVGDETADTLNDHQTETEMDGVDDTDCSSLLKIVNVVSLRDEPGESFGTLPEECSTTDSGAISLEAAKSAVSALFNKTSDDEIYVDSNCKLCDKKFSSMFLLLTHLRVIHRQMCYFSCPLCKVSLGQQKHAVKEHLAVEHDSCEFPMEVHILSESEFPTAKDTSVVEGIKCQHCSVYEPSAGAMLKHLEATHGEDCLLVCPYCRKGISKVEEDTYAHIQSEHKNYDAFVPLLLDINRSSGVEKSEFRPSLTISKSSRQMFMKKTLNSSMFPLKKTDSSDNLLTKSKERLDTKTSFNSSGEQDPPARTESENESSMSPLAMLTQSTSTILNRAHPEVLDSNSSRQSPEPQILGTTLSAIFNLQQEPTLQKPERQFPVSVSPRTNLADHSNKILLNAAHPNKDSRSSNIRFTSSQGMAQEWQTGSRQVIPRGIKHVEKRPVKNIKSSPKAFVHPRIGQHFSSPEHPSTPPGLSTIPALIPATARTTTVTRPLLKIPSVMPSSSPRPYQNLNDTNIGTDRPRSSLGTPKQPVNTSDAPLDLSKPSQKAPEPLVEDDIDPEAFSVFNLAPTKGDFLSQPLNLSIPSAKPPVWEDPRQAVGYPGGYGSYQLMERPCTPRSRSPMVGHHNFSRFQTMPVARHLNPGFVSNRPRLPSAAVGTPPLNQLHERSSNNRTLQTPQNWDPSIQRYHLAQSAFNSQMTPTGMMGSSHQSMYKKMVCPHCNFGTLSEATMKAHITKMHKARYRCPYCPELVTLSRLDVYLHINQAHPGKRVMYFNL